MSTYYAQIFDDGSGNFTVLAQNGGNAPTAGTSLTIPHLSNNNAAVQSATFTAATKANPCVVTATHAFAVGDIVTIGGVVGMTQLNNLTAKVSAVSGTATFTLSGIDSSAFGTWTSGGIATKIGPTKLIHVALQAISRAILNDRASGN